MSRAYPGDVVYFHKSGSPVTGKVLAAGKHGCTVEHEGQQHKVKWEHVSGHKSRAPQKYAVIDHGEDGMIVQNQHGHRRFLAIPQEGRGEHLALEKSASTEGVELLKSQNARDEHTISLTISGSKEAVERIEALISMVALSGYSGHSGIFGISWDGDGADSINVDGIELGKYRKLLDATSGYGGEAEIVGEGGYGYVMTMSGSLKRVYSPDSSSMAKAATDSGRIVGDRYEMPLDDAIREHEELVDALQSPTKTDDQEQINKQGAELEKMKRRRKLLAMKKA